MRPGWESCAANWQGSVACRERISLEGSLSSRCSNCNYVYCVFFLVVLISVLISSGIETLFQVVCSSRLLELGGFRGGRSEVRQLG